MSTYVIGDVHGEFNQLLDLLNTMDFFLRIGCM